jgi:hypothetical protein
VLRRRVFPWLLYNSSLKLSRFTLLPLKISQTLSVILTVDEDPIFGQIIFTLFRAIQHSNLDKAYKSVAEALYQDFLRQDQEIAKVS